jgi:hypothetical protein
MATMTPSEREAFLADLHVGVLSVPDPDPARSALAVPIWYAYAPGGTVDIVTSPTSAKGEALAKAGRFSLVAQREPLPYRYVSVEGPIVATDPCDLERDLRPLAIRYLGDAAGSAYADGWLALDPGATTFRMRPERWLSYDSTGELDG